MSRNVQRKTPTTPKGAKPSKRRASTSSLSSSSSLSLPDDEEEAGYSGVDDISDAEDDDEDDVDAAEEKNMITERKPRYSPRPRIDESDNDGDEEEEEEEDEEEEDDDTDEDEDEEDDHVHDDDTAQHAPWHGITSDVDDSQVSEFYQEATHFSSDAAVERHVRFNIPFSDSDITDTDDEVVKNNDFFPDLFVSQNSLDPTFRREIEEDAEDSSASGTFWDFHGSSENHADPDSNVRSSHVQNLLDAPGLPRHHPSADPVPAVDMEEQQDLDGYETDGETTEEDIPEPLIRRKTRRPSNALTEYSDSDLDRPVRPQRGPPRLRRFRLDRPDAKPIVVANPHVKRLMVFHCQRRGEADLSPEQYELPLPFDVQSSPILANSASMMLSAMRATDTFDDFLNTQPVGPAEAFFSFQPDFAPADESSELPSAVEEEEEEVDAGEKKLNVLDFIKWDSHTDGDAASSADEQTETNWEPSSTPARPSTSREGNPLSHLNSDTVGAFRRNQVNQRLILSNNATQDSLAFSGPYHHTALRGLRSDRFDTAGVPLTPVRRHKRQPSDTTRSPLDAVSAKRKAEGEASATVNHKKQRSISDVNNLNIG